MATVTCQHSNIEFEAKSTRTKQHPLVAAFKTEHSKHDYQRAINALDAAREAGGYETIEEFMVLVEQAFNLQLDANRQEIARRVADERAAADRKHAYEVENNRLRAAGYRYIRVDHSDFGLSEEPYTLLISPDGGEVTRQQALAEIARRTGEE